VTLESIAMGFGVDLELCEEIVAIFERFNLPQDEMTLRMARVPAGTQLVSGVGLTYPLLQFRNVYILPGVPKLVRKKFEAIASRFAGAQVLTTRVYARDRETSVAARLAGIDKENPLVQIGSYPRFGEEPWHLVVTLESHDADALAAATEQVRGLLDVMDGPQ
jgi:molybdopterin-biosynthesis enzyme MoeA-like protein